jgi:hypothetical protein
MFCIDSYDMGIGFAGLSPPGDSSSEGTGLWMIAEEMELIPSNGVGEIEDLIDDQDSSGYSRSGWDNMTC